MSTNEIRKSLHRYIDQLDGRFLSAMYSMLNTYLEKKHEVVGYRADGTPISKDELIKDLQEAEDQITRGEYLTIDELEKESEDW